MKYNQAQKQNQRIQYISEQDLIVGADIAKETHVSRAIDFRGIELGKDCTFQNDLTGFETWLNWMQALCLQHLKTRVIVGIEPTGHYWFAMAEYLLKAGVKLVIVNPHHVNKSKELEDNSQTKNDYKDAKLIANLVRNGHYSEPKLPTKQFAELRILMNQREKIADQMGQVQRRIQNWLDRFFPEFTRVFSSWEGKAALITLRKFPLPADMQNRQAEQIVAEWKPEVKRAVGVKRAQLLIETARTSIGMTEGIRAARMELRMYLEQYDLFAGQLKEQMTEVEAILATIPGTQEMLTVPGIGITTVAGVLAEVGDLNDYEHSQQIVRLAGLNLKENSSGKRKGKPGISKRGRSRLRAILFRAVMPMVAKNAEFKAMHEYFTTRAVNALKKKQSIVALCNKLIRVLFTLGTKQLSYDSKQVLGPVRTEQMQLAA